MKWEKGVLSLAVFVIVLSASGCVGRKRNVVDSLCPTMGLISNYYPTCSEVNEVMHFAKVHDFLEVYAGSVELYCRQEKYVNCFAP